MPCTPLISVIIPAYNEEKNIAKCLQSIARQTLPKYKYQIIVIDNCSTDKTAAIAKKFYATVLTERKKGYINALTKGLNYATSPLLAVTDADSVANRDWLARLTDIYLKNPHVGYVTGTMLYVPTSNLLNFIINTVLNTGGRIFKIGCGFHMTFRKEAWKKIAPFPENLNFNSDGWIALEIGKRGYKRYFIQDNWVKTSARHIGGIVGAKYMTKSALNLLGLLLFNRTFYYEFGDVRE